MNTLNLRLESCSIVAIGGLNPAIFHPMWFSSNGLIRASEAEVARDLMCTNEITSFECEWLSLQVTNQRFVAQTIDASMKLPLRDLVSSTFQILEHTHLRSFGFNFEQHLTFSSADDYNRLGHYYVPKAPWNAILDDPKTLAVSVLGKRSGCTANSIQIKIVPTSTPYTVAFSINQHYDIAAGNQLYPNEGIPTLLRTLSDEWEEFLSFAASSLSKLSHLPPENE